MQKLTDTLKRNWFLLAVLGLFTGLAGKIALTRVFPLPYDEGYHFGLIKLYTHHLNPFLPAQPASADAFGAVTRDGSYLYHYLFSFPLHVVQLFTHDQIAQVITLRLLNVGLGLVTLLLMRKLVLRFGVPKLGANLAVLTLAITPVFYDLAGQINYDNLLIPLTLVSLLQAWRVTDAIRAGRLRLRSLLVLGSLLLLTSLVKYSFLPIMLAIALYIGWQLIRNHAGKLTVRASFRELHTVRVAGLLLVLLLATTMWLQRYGVNIVQYHTPEPQCQAVLNVNECSAYGPWYRNYQLHETYAAHPVSVGQLIRFPKVWLGTMYHGVFSVVHFEGTAVVFTTVRLLIDATGILIIGAILYICWRFRRFVDSSIPWGLLLAVIISYGLTLLAQNVSDFRHLGALVAVQGRYLLPILPIGYALLARCYSLLIRDIQLEKLRLVAMEYMIAVLLVYAETARRIRRTVGRLAVTAHIALPKYRSYP